MSEVATPKQILRQIKEKFNNAVTENLNESPSLEKCLLCALEMKRFSVIFLKGSYCVYLHATTTEMLKKTKYKTKKTAELTLKSHKLILCLGNNENVYSYG
ncbi:Hypothetical predicted protein [Octopus vulgaris]|uniref:Uncharacterized protein n=1 Tax=Octopus vulgaris TaxID=6645 RepID=A0AA36FBJ7_OCTVU|nr:Hypothetical predicted protein [Octopus vulgaris]